MACAFVLEVTADLQLDAFKADRADDGALLSTGTWAWSRHPNYFANCCCFWAIFAISWGGAEFEVDDPLATVHAPLLIGFTGKRWINQHMKKRRPAYAVYIKNTRGFIPWPPKRKR